MCLPDTAPPCGLLCRTLSDQLDKLIVAQWAKVMNVASHILLLVIPAPCECEPDILYPFVSTNHSCLRQNAGIALAVKSALITYL